MAKLIPNEVDWSDPRRNGERIVFECLSDANIPGTAFYSLLQKNHKHVEAKQYTSKQAMHWLKKLKKGNKKKILKTNENKNAKVQNL